MGPLSNLSQAWKLLRLNKTNIFLTLIPVCIGIALYAVAGVGFYSWAVNYGNQLISSYVSSGWFGEIVSFFIKVLITVLIFFLTNWTFVLLVTVLSAPFNDILSARIERYVNNQTELNLADSFKLVGEKFFPNLLNEGKKLILIITFGVLAFILGYIPFLTPVSIFITILLLAVEFLDYSWSRHHLSFSSCLSDVRRNLMKYSIGGGLFFLMVSVPIINLIVPSLATSYFTLLWIKNNENRNQIT